MSKKRADDWSSIFESKIKLFPQFSADASAVPLIAGALVRIEQSRWAKQRKRRTVLAGRTR
jgi:hypothetical protein